MLSALEVIRMKTQMYTKNAVSGIRKLSDVEAARTCGGAVGGSDVQGIAPMGVPGLLLADGGLGLSAVSPVAFVFLATNILNPPPPKLTML